MPPIRPFGDLAQLFQRLAIQQSSPQVPLIEARLKQIQQEQFRSNLLTDYLRRVDPNNTKISDIMGFVAQVTGDPRAIEKMVDARVREEAIARTDRIFAEKQAAIEKFGSLQEQTLSPESVGGTTRTLEEESMLISQAPTPQLGQLVKGTGVDAELRQLDIDAKKALIRRRKTLESGSKIGKGKNSQDELKTLSQFTKDAISEIKELSKETQLNFIQDETGQTRLRPENVQRINELRQQIENTNQRRAILNGTRRPNSLEELLLWGRQGLINEDEFVGLAQKHRLKIDVTR